MQHSALPNCITARYAQTMIGSFRSKELHAVANGNVPKGFPSDMARRTRLLLTLLEAVVDFGDTRDRMDRSTGKERGAARIGMLAISRDAVRCFDPCDRRWPAAIRPTASRRLQVARYVRRTAPCGRNAVGHYGRRKSPQQPLDAAATLDDLRSPPGNRLEALSGDRAGQHSIRVNRPWRLCFTWTPSGPSDVEFVDYH